MISHFKKRKKIIHVPHSKTLSKQKQSKACKMGLDCIGHGSMAIGVMRLLAGLFPMEGSLVEDVDFCFPSFFSASIFTLFATTGPSFGASSISKSSGFSTGQLLLSSAVFFCSTHKIDTRICERKQLRNEMVKQKVIIVCVGEPYLVR